MKQQTKREARSANTELFAIRRGTDDMKRSAFYTMLFVLCFMLIAVWGCATTGTSKELQQSQEPTVITGIDIQDHAVVVTANKPFVYTIYKPGDPYKMIIDIPDVHIGAFNKKIVSSKTGITEIVPSQIPSPFIARIEILVQIPSLIDQDYKNNVLTVTIKEDPAAPKLAANPGDIKVADLLRDEKRRSVSENNPNPDSPLSSKLPKATEVTEISFDTSGNAVKVLVKGNGSMIPNVFPLDNRIVIDIADVTMNAAIPSSVISPVQGIRAGKHDDNMVRVVLDLKEQTNFDVAAINDSIVITLRKYGQGMPAIASSQMAEMKEEEIAEPTEIKGPAALTDNRCQAYMAGKETVNFDFQDQDIVPIFRLFADISGCNLFIHPDVRGKATMKFRDVPWNQAFDTILKTFSLDKSIEGNVIRIAPHTVFAKESEEKVKAQEASVKAEPLETKIFPISYAEVSIVEAAIRNAKILTPRGSLNVDKRTSTMLVKDVASIFPEVENILQTLDKPTPQVLIEGRIVEINTNNERELGIQWGINMHTTNTLLTAGGLQGVPFTSPGAFTGGNYLVDFPAKGVGALSGSGITFGIIDAARTVGLDVQLSAIETVGNLKVVSNPKILTVDNGKAKILQGKSIPVRKLTTEGTISTEFKDVTLELNVTPHITPDKSIGMALEIKKEELDPTVPSVEGVPGTDKKEANTNVIIKDGETIVIGGMYKLTTNESESGVPGLMKIPILGWLFKSNKVTESTTELLIFITPRILEKQ